MTNKMTTIQIVKAGVPDIPQLCRISRETFLETFAESNTEEDMDRYLQESMSPEQLLKELETPGSDFYLALLDGAVTGYLKINTGEAQTEKMKEHSLEVERIYVLKQYQGKQIGLRLIEEAFHLAKMQNIGKVWLGVWEHNYKAIAFYERLGFAAFDKHIFRLGQDEQTDILMRKYLDL